MEIYREPDGTLGRNFLTVGHVCSYTNKFKSHQEQNYYKERGVHKHPPPLPPATFGVVSSDRFVNEMNCATLFTKLTRFAQSPG